MDLATGNGKYTTTVQIPLWLAHKVKAKGMTWQQLVIAGWEAMEERQNWNEKFEQQARMMELAKSTIKDLRMRVAKIEDGELE